MPRLAVVPKRMRAANMKRVLRSVVFFESLSESDLQQLVDMAVGCSVDKGAVLFSEGRVENHLYLLEQGCVEISRDGPNFGRQIFARLGPGEHFGALSLFYSEAHFATATAVEPTRLWIIRHEDFQTCLRRDPQLALAILKGMSSGIRAANAEIRRWTTRFDRRSRPPIELPAKSRTIPPAGPAPPG
ncbi:MAG TPA: cyclic nucleotide-binding domain-containing protein [Vicinamibacteria bacterium]